MLIHEDQLQQQGYSCIAGVDEVGVGPWAGPVLACACILKESTFDSIINDSKKLTEKRREKAYQEIIQKSYVGIGIVDSLTIDKINILQATLLAAHKAIKNLPKIPDYLLTDGKLHIHSCGIPYQSLVDGDAKVLSISCASIVAKVTRDRMMKDFAKRYPGYGFEKHKGYGTLLHRETLAEYGPCEIHRMSYRPVAESRNRGKR